MHRIDTLTAVKDKFGPGKNGFTDGNLRTGRLATWLNSAMWDAIQEEICGVIEKAGIELNKEEHDQLYKAILLLVGGAINEEALLIKNNLSDVEDKDEAVENLGLKPTVDKAKNAVQRDGDTMTGKLTLPQTSGFGVNTDNALGGNSIAFGDNDTGIKQGGDGVLLFYSNGQLAFGLQPASADFYKRVAYIHQGITPDGSGAFADQLNNATAPFVQTRFAWNPAPGGHYVPIVKGLSVRNGQGYPGAVSFGYLLTEQQGFPVPCIHMRGDNGNESLWQFNPNDKSFFSPGPVIAGGAILASNGDINGAAWGGWLSAYLRNNTGVQDVRYGSEMYYNPGGNQISWTVVDR